MAAFREKDFIKRAIEQFGLVMQRVLALRRERKFEEAMQALDGLRQDLIGTPRSLLEVLDAPSAAALIGDAAKIRMWAKLVREEGVLLEDQGRDASDRFRQAAQLMLEATSKSAATEDDRAFLKELTGRVPPEELGPGYQGRLQKILA